MAQFGSSMLWFWLAYVVVTLIGVGHTVFNIYVLHMKPMSGTSMGEGYERTKPYHPLYNIVVFSLAAWLYLSALPSRSPGDAVVTSIVWTSITIVVDLVGWVLIKHPWSLSFRAFYVDYQPWISLIYLAIAASPFVGLGLASI